MSLELYMLSMFSQKKTSKIIPATRFQPASPQEDYNNYVSGAITSNITLLQKKLKNSPGVKPHIWISKIPPNIEQYNDNEKLAYQIQSRCEVFSAWQYEAFVGASNTQPKYYLVKHPNNMVSVASKHVTGYKSIWQFSTNKALRKIFSENNLKLFSQMLVNYIWLAGSDFKRDHIGIDNNNALICLDFGLSLIDFRSPTTYQAKGWNFSLTSSDLSTAPFFVTYKTSNFFVDELKKELAFLTNTPEFKNQFFTAVLKKCIFPDYITFVALELFDDLGLSAEIKEHIQKRTKALLDAAVNNNEFCEFILQQGDDVFPDIHNEISSGELKNARYFKNSQVEFEMIFKEQLHFNYRALRSTIKLNGLQKKSQSASEILRFLRDFCYLQFQIQRSIHDKNFFNKGAKDKCTFYSNILDKIDSTDFSIVNVDSLESSILDLVREIAIVAHHKRYSTYAMIFGVKQSAGWGKFMTVSDVLGPKHKYMPKVREILNDKSQRKITIANQAIDTYHNYRIFTHNHAATAPTEDDKLDAVVNKNEISLYLERNKCTDQKSLLGQKNIVMSAVNDFMKGKRTWFNVCEKMTHNPSWDEGFFSQAKKIINGIRQGNVTTSREEQLYDDYVNIKTHLKIIQSTPGAALKRTEEYKANKILNALYEQLQSNNPPVFNHKKIGEDLSSISSPDVCSLLELFYKNIKTYLKTKDSPCHRDLENDFTNTKCLIN